MSPMTRNHILVALVAAALAACSGSPTKESTGEYLDDSATTTRIKSAFVADSQVSALNIAVETFKGNVQLSGYADNLQEIQRADQLAHGVPGVKSVKNDIRLKAN